MRLLWSQTLPAPVRGLSLARESEAILTWDGQDHLFVFNRAGSIQAQRPSPEPITTACCTEDGSAYVVVGSRSPTLYWMAPDLTPRWQKTLRHRATALALDPLGRCLAVAYADGSLQLMDARGKTLWRATTLRPLHHLAFVAEKPLLVGASDFGLVVCFGADGECLWRDGLVAHVGSLAVNGDGSSALLACFGDGLVLYDTSGPEQQRIPLESACPLAALSYDGAALFTVDRQNGVSRRDGKGVLREQINLDAPTAAISVGALGEFAIVGSSKTLSKIA